MILLVDSFNFNFLDEDRSDIYVVVHFFYLVTSVLRRQNRIKKDYYIHCLHEIHTQLVQWIVLWFCDSRVAGSIPALNVRAMSPVER